MDVQVCVWETLSRLLWIILSQAGGKLKINEVGRNFRNAGGHYYNIHVEALKPLSELPKMD